MTINKLPRALGALFVSFMLLAAMPLMASAGESKSFKKFPEIVDYKFVAKYAKVPRPAKSLIIDSRPYKPKYVAGFVPSAVSIPASQFDKMTDQLPKNKSTLLIFYCGGLKCPLSHKSAFKARELGYTNVKVYAKGFPDWKKNALYHSIGLETLKAKMEAGENYMLVDARPLKKFLDGAIPSAISIPERQFSEKRGMLPADKANTEVIYYCGGFKCPLSHKSAIKARYLGYKNVVVAEAGYPGWKELYGVGAGVQAQAGEMEGSIDTEQFLTVLKGNPDQFLFIDVRSPEEYAAGHFPPAINIPVDDLEKRIDEIPTDKPIVFSCASGARAGEAYYMFKDMRPDVKEVFYLEATNEFTEDNQYTVTPNK